MMENIYFLNLSVYLCKACQKTHTKNYRKQKGIIKWISTIIRPNCEGFSLIVMSKKCPKVAFFLKLVLLEIIKYVCSHNEEFECRCFSDFDQYFGPEV